MTPAPRHDDRRLRVGLAPASEARARPRLIEALERLYPVRLEPREPGELNDLDALVCIGDSALVTAEAAPRELPRFAGLTAERVAGAPRVVDLADDAALERPLHGARLHDGAAGALAHAVAGGARVLATIDHVPSWILRAGDGEVLHVVATAPGELGEGELLRERLVPGRCLAMLALTHFLRGLTLAHDWRPPPLRASFVLDDPNLHWPTYGHLRYRELLAHAARHRYHLAVAMIPLDAWLVHPGVARMFRDGADYVSVLVHGNDHDGGELGRVQSEAAGLRLAAQALRRIERFERRSGVRVSRVMAPPHERVTEPALHGLLACGFEAVSTARPFPWVQADGPSWLIHPPGADPLTASTPSHTTSDGLPIVLRLDFAHPREELVLRAYLGQPLVVYGHHGDLADGLDVLAEAAAQINRLGDVEWMALDQLARASAQTRVDGATLHVHPLARRVSVAIPAGVKQVRVLPGTCAAGARALRWGTAGEKPSQAAPDVELVAPVQGPGTFELALIGAAPDVPSAAGPRWRPLARRLATEGRDRLRAVI